MEQREAVAFIERAISRRGGIWADLGAGSGVFTRALASLVGPDGTVYAVDRDEAALRDVGHPASKTRAAIATMVGDFTKPIDLPMLDGVLLANALHYVPYDAQAALLRRIGTLVSPDGAIVIVEYDRREANRWVPYPVGAAALAREAAAAGLTSPTILATRPSQYSGTMYSAVMRLSSRAEAKAAT